MSKFSDLWVYRNVYCCQKCRAQNYALMKHTVDWMCYKFNHILLFLNWSIFRSSMPFGDKICVFRKIWKTAVLWLKFYYAITQISKYLLYSINAEFSVLYFYNVPTFWCKVYLWRNLRKTVRIPSILKTYSCSCTRRSHRD